MLGSVVFACKQFWKSIPFKGLADFEKFLTRFCGVMKRQEGYYTPLNIFFAGYNTPLYGALTKYPCSEHPSNILTPSKLPPTQCPSVYSVHCDIWSQSGRIVRPPLNISLWTFFGAHTFLANPTVWHFVPCLHFILMYLTSIFPIKIVTFHLIATFRLFVTSHPDCFYFPFSNFVIFFHYVTLVLPWHILSICWDVSQTKQKSANPWISVLCALI